jgi:hypothetical protein
MTPRSTKQLIMGFVLLLIGVVFLAINFGWLTIDFWTLFWRFWPVALLLVGLRFLISNAVVYTLLAVVLVGAAVWAVSYSPEPIRTQLRGDSNPSNQIHEQQNFDEPLDEVKKLKFNLDLGAATIEIRDQSNDDKAYEAVFENSPLIRERIERQGDELKVILDQRPGQDVFWKNLGTRFAEIKLNSTIPVEFELDGGASKQDLDFSKINLERLKLDIGASSGSLKLGSLADNLEVTIDAGASSLALSVPSKVGLKVVSDSGLSSNNFTDAGLTRNGDTYQSANFDSQEHKITVRLDAGASSVKLERY